MESKRATAGAPKQKADLENLNKQIAAMKERHLPHIPHLLTVNTTHDDPYKNEYPNENKNSPFEWWEVRPLQYMTLVSDAERGIALAKGDWEDEYSGPPPRNGEARSNTATPNSFNKDTKKPSVKYSIKDYKNMKQTGVKPSPRPATTESERKLGHSRTTSAISTNTPMPHAASIDGSRPPGATVKQNGANFTVNSLKTDKELREQRLNALPPPRPEPKEKSRPATNGHIDHPVRDPVQIKDSITKVQKPDLQRATQHLKHALPARPQSPRRDRQVSDLKKRPLESATAPPEKRTKIEPTRTPNSHNPPPRNRVESKPSLLKPQKSQPPSAQPSPLPKKIGQHPKAIDSKNTSKAKEKPLDIPPLLSPLPEDLETDPISHPSVIANVKKSDSGKNSLSNHTPSKSKTNNDTTVVKNSLTDSSPLSTPPDSSSPFSLPTMLSPGLPEVIEQELLKLQKLAPANTVEARHEKARQPDTPGVARKTVKSKVGHPPKKVAAEPSKAQEKDKPSLIVCLPYKKPMKKTIERLLSLKPTPSVEFKKREARLASNQSSSQNHMSDSEEDALLAAVTKPTPQIARKRPIEATEHRSADPPPKRAKPSEKLESPKPNNALKAPFKSPAATAPPDKNPLSTPKRSDAMKSVAMRKVDSNDGHARTPQGASQSQSTPASAEKPRVNGDTRVASQEVREEVDKLKADEKRLAMQAGKVKHKMDDILKLKSKERPVVSEPQRQLGLSVGLECLTIYMNSFSTNNRIASFSKTLPSSNQWESLIRLWEFIDSSCREYPILQALSVRLGALIREELRRAAIDSKEYSNSDPKYLHMLKGVAKDQDKLWMRVHNTQSVLNDLGFKEVLGPWTTVPEITSFVISALGAYSKKEKLNWKRDSGA